MFNNKPFKDLSTTITLLYLAAKANPYCRGFSEKKIFYIVGYAAAYTTDVSLQIRDSDIEFASVSRLGECNLIPYSAEYASSDRIHSEPNGYLWGFTMQMMCSIVEANENMKGNFPRQRIVDTIAGRSEVVLRAINKAMKTPPTSREYKEAVSIIDIFVSDDQFQELLEEYTH